MKLACCYNTFDGVSLLPYAIKQIRKNTDFIMINYQNKDWYGNPIKPEDLLMIIELKKSGLVDHLNCFQLPQIANSPAEAKELEKLKRNQGREYCYNHGYTHFVDSDVDEFYKEEEFLQAKTYIEEKGIWYSAVKFKNYYKTPNIRAKGLSEAVVPFICKLDNCHSLGGAAFLGKTDPTRAYNLDHIAEHIKYLFPPEQLIMHHMTGVRKDLYQKFQATSLANFNRGRVNEVIHNINSLNKDCLNIQSDINIMSTNFEWVEDYFNILGEAYL